MSPLTAKDSLALQPLVVHWLGSISVCCAVLFTYASVVRLSENRWPGEISPAGLRVWLPSGVVIGSALIVSAAMLISWGGWSTVVQIRPRSEWPGLLALALADQLAVASVEEILMRGLLFRLLEERLGSWWALAISAVLFGLAHLGNDKATLAGALGLSLQAGVFLGAAFMVSRSLWFPIGIHWAWNGLQAGVLGGALSGTNVHAIYVTTPVGPAYLSGGAFGLEGSIIATALCATLGVFFCLAAVKMQSIRCGFWARDSLGPGPADADPSHPSS